MKDQIEITNMKEKRNYGVVEVKLVFYTPWGGLFPVISGQSEISETLVFSYSVSSYDFICVYILGQDSKIGTGGLIQTYAIKSGHHYDMYGTYIFQRLLLTFGAATRNKVKLRTKK
jgi:hypothetical protein